MNNSRQQGTHGESLFSALCTAPNSKHNATLNPSTNDQHGWDFFVEIEPSVGSDLPADLQEPNIQCLAQIKTTRANVPKIKLRLSNAIKAIQSSFPTFVFLFQFSNHSDQPRLYGRHIWKTEIEKWLKRARELERIEKLPHQVEATLTFADNDLVDENPADWIMSRVKEVGEDYPAQKKDVASRIGYDSFTKQGTIEIGPLETFDAIADHELGLRDSLPIQSGNLYDVRFGIRSRKPIREWGPGKIRISFDGKPVKLRFYTASQQHVELDALCWHQRSIDLDDPNFRMRIKTAHFDFLVKPNGESQNFDLSFNLDSIGTVFEHHQHLTLVNALPHGETDFEIAIETGVLLKGRFRFDAQPNASLIDFESAVNWLCNILTEAVSRKLEVSADELVSICGQANFTRQILSGKNIKISNKFKNETGIFHKIAGYTYFPAGIFYIGLVFEIELFKSEVVDGETNFYLNNPKIIRKSAFKEDKHQCKSRTHAYFQDHLANIDYAVGIFQQGDIIELQKAIMKDGLLKFEIK
ncbi:hypothetical protein MXMO3_00867 [Maritalea myrionectae]|uniref:DUF4365 domain-containing protein n=1 Tax=Maritalea myrionectae TaxID=454601 RepID=A0A2R4MC03_9HYPH|nr:hypothetical protein [Maritalea myrionectae]AVX03399.1 hypothetical protein MXMO3_00867 [Maritalea myrionectae]